MASSSRTSQRPSAAPTPQPPPSSPPPPSESFFSELDGTAPSLLGSTADFAGYAGWDTGKLDGSPLNLVSWKRAASAEAADEGEEGGEGRGEVLDDVQTRGFFAISTVLNHPGKRANPLRSTRKPLPPLPPPLAIAKPPPPSHYDAYLKSVTPLYETLLSRQTQTAPLTGAFDTRPPDTPSLPPLGDIPDIFFSSSFDLSTPSTWSAATLSGTKRGPELQDDLSSHLDTLERHLIHEITLRSTSFFSALANLQDLHSESASCLARIAQLQTGLREIGETTAKRGLEVIGQQDTLHVLRATERGLDELKELENLLERTKTVIDAGDWSAGLGCLGDVQKWWEQHLPVLGDEGPLPLSTLPALEPLPQLFKDVTTQLALQLESALHEYLLSTLSAAELDGAYDKERFRDHVAPMIEGLARCGAADGVEGVWRDVITVAVREGSRKHLPMSQAETEAEGSAQEMRGENLAQALRSMDHGHYFRLSSSMYHTMLARLRLASELGAALSALSSRSASTSSSALAPLHLDLPSAIGISINETPAAPSAADMDLAEILAGACDLANVRASKILGVRGEQHAGLAIEQFVQVFKTNWDFIVATEELGGRAIPALRGVTSSQARTFLITYHSHRLTRSAKLVEEEQWAQIDVTPAMQHGVDLVIRAATDDPAECFVPPRTDASWSKVDGNGNGSANGGGEATSKTLDVESAKFFVVRATAETILLLSEYLRVVVNLEVVVTDVMGRIIEFLKSFNSRTCQVVLGAGAMRSAGLKNITAKHLALASQSLSVIVALIPYIREFIRRHLGAKQAVMLTEFDKLKRDYQEHQNEIHAKLVAIMSDRLAVHCGSLRDINWETAPCKDAPRQYAEMLVKETATLHKVLSKYLAVGTVESVMSEVLAAIVHRLSEEYSRIELKSDEAKKRMTQDVELISARLQPLSESGQTIASLETLVKDKPVPRKNVLGSLLRRGKKENGEVEGGTDGAAVEGNDEKAGEIGDVEDEEAPAKPPAESRPDETNGGAAGEEKAVAEANGPADSASAAQTLAPASTEDEPVGSVPLTTSDVVAEPVDLASAPPPPARSELKVDTGQTSPASGKAELPAVPPAPPAKPFSPARASLPLPPPPREPAATDPALPIAAPQPLRLSDNAPAATLQQSISPGPAPPARSSFEAPVGSPVSFSSVRSPPPAPPGVGGAPQPGTPTRAPRISLANRLKGVITRAGSVDAGSPGTSPSASPVRELQRGSKEYVRGRSSLEEMREDVVGSELEPGVGLGSGLGEEMRRRAEAGGLLLPVSPFGEERAGDLPAPVFASSAGVAALPTRTGQDDETPNEVNAPMPGVGQATVDASGEDEGLEGPTALQATDGDGDGVPSSSKQEPQPEAVAGELKSSGSGEGIDGRGAPVELTIPDQAKVADPEPHLEEAIQRAGVEETTRSETGGGLASEAVVGAPTDAVVTHIADGPAT